MRYGANRPATAARELFATRNLTEADGELWLVALDSFPSALNLTRQGNLDALGLDDRVSTGRIDTDQRRDPDPLLETCGQLSDAVFDWWGGSPPPLLYRARTMPATGRSIALGRWASPRATRVGQLHEAVALLSYLVLRAGFTVPLEWIA